MTNEEPKKQARNGRSSRSRADAPLDAREGVSREGGSEVAPTRWWMRRPARVGRLLPGGIRERLFLLIALAMIPALLLQGWIYYGHYTARRSAAMRTELEVAQGVARTFTGYLNDVRRQLNTVGQAIITFDPYTDVQAEHLLGTVVDQYPMVRNVSWVDPEGLILASSQPDLVDANLSHRPYFQEIVAGQSWSLGDLMPRGSVTQTPIFVIASAVKDSQGALLGLVVAAIEPMRLGERTFEPERPVGGAYTIFDRQGQLVYRSPETPLTWEQHTQWRESDPLLQQALDGRVAQGTITSVIDGDRHIATRVPIPGIDWVVGSSRPARIALGPVRLALIRETTLGLLVTAFALLIASLIARTIARPLLRLEEDAEAMGEGRIRRAGDADSPREVRRLRSTMTQMAADLIERAESLRESEHRYRTLFTNMSEGFALGEAVFDNSEDACDFRFIEINEAFEQQSGLTREILNRPMTEVLPNLEQSWIDTYCSVVLTGRPVRFINYNRDTDRHYDVYCYSPAPGRFAILFRDVTEARLAQEELRRRAEEVETLMEVAPVAIWVSHDPQCNEIVGNRAADRFYEAHEQENVSANVSPVRRFFRNGKELKPEDLPMQKAAARNMDIRNVELDVLLPSGRGLNMLGSASPLRDADGRVRGCVGAFMDITERKWAEEKLRQSEARLNHAQEMAHLGSWDLDLITNQLTWSDEVYRIFGCKAREFGATYEAFLERVHPDDRQAVNDAYSSSLREGRDSYEIEHRIVRKDTGEVRIVHERCEHVRDVTGRIVRSVGMVHDITERKLAEEAVHSAALFPEENPSPVLRVAGDGTLLYANASSAPLLEQWDCRLGQAIPDEIRRHVAHTLNAGQAAEIEVPCAGIVCSFSIAPVVSEGYVNLYGRDVTEAKRAEDALRASEERHRRLIENLKGSHFVYVHDTNGVFKYLSESLTDILGYTPDEFMARYDTYMTDHPANQAVYRYTELSIQGIRQPPYEVNIWHKDGSTRWLEVQEVPIFDPEGKVVAVEGVAQDITERKRTEEALRESEQWFRTLANTMPQLVWTADPDGKVDYYNQRYKEYQGIAPTTDGTFHWAPVLHEDDVAPTVEAWEQAVRTGQGYQIEHRVRLSDGSYRWHLSRGMPVRDSEGRIVKWFGTATDIDNVKRTEEALRELTATLESRVARRTAELEHRTHQLQKLTMELSQAEDRERKRLADLLHDDLQQQLAAAKFQLNLVGHRVKDDGSLREAIAQVGELLKDAIAKSRSLSHELSPAMLYHGDFGEAVEWLAHQFEAKHGLAVHVEVCGRVEVASEPVRAFLFRTTQEILFNIIKHANVAQASIRLRRRNGRVWLTVSDRGRGFDPKALGQAAGLGLLSIRERVELLGGRMRIRSAPGRGSTFLIAVPDRERTQDREQKTEDDEEIIDSSSWPGRPALASRGHLVDKLGAGSGPAMPDHDVPATSERAVTATEEQGRDALATTAEPHADNRLRVLLVDDHKVVREGLATLLNEQEDIEVVGQATNGQEAVELAHELHPDVVVMDVAMPVMEGDEATRRIKRDLPQTRVVGLSMFDEPAMIERMHNAGAEHYMLKTAPSEELLTAIRDG